MKKTLLLLFILIAPLTNAQKLTKSKLIGLELKNNKQIVKQALTYRDAQTAINSLHHIIALEGVNSSYKDSLAITYYNVGNYVSSHLLAKELLVTKPNNLQLLEINAVSLKNLNLSKEAIEAYEVLFAKTKNMAHGYQLAMLQFGIKRLVEAQTTIAQTLQSTPLENAYLQFPVDKETNQKVPLKAAAYNLKGLIAFELKDNATASSAFSKALEVMPKFALASQNANAVTVTMQKERKENTPVKNKK